MRAGAIKALERAEAFRNTGTKPLDLTAVLFGPQCRYVSSKAKFRTACCSRRAGKTGGTPAGLIDSAIARPGSFSFYLTTDRTDAKQLMWDALIDANELYGLRGTTNASDLTLKLPNRSTVLLAGAGDVRKIAKRRGFAIGRCVVDEAQNFPSAALEKLIDDVIVPATIDFDGDIWLQGTPGPVAAGYFYKACQSDAWEHHAWTCFQNPWLERKSGKTPRQLLEAELKRRGLTEDSPSIQREWFGRWVHDPESLVFKWDAARNAYSSLPTGVAWQCVLGVDLGFEDADAIAVLVWHKDSPDIWLAEESIEPHQSITQLESRLQALVSKWRPIAIVADFGGLGKKIAEELSGRTKLTIEPAEKERKAEHIELLNDALRTGRFHAKADSRFAQDAMLVQWDWDKCTQDRLVMKAEPHSDILDSALYAYRRALHWLHEPKSTEPEYGTTEYWAKREREEEESDMAAVRYGDDAIASDLANWRMPEA